MLEKYFLEKSISFLRTYSVVFPLDGFCKGGGGDFFTGFGFGFLRNAENFAKLFHGVVLFKLFFFVFFLFFDLILFIYINI